MRGLLWSAIWLVGSCGGEPVLLPPAATTPKEIVASTQTPDVPVEGLKPGSTSTWSGSGALAQVELKLGEASLKDSLKAHFVTASSQGLKPYVMVYSDTCDPCVALRGSLEDPLMAEAFRGVYLILLNQMAWGIHMDEVGMKSGSFPRIHEVTDNGQASLRVITGAAWGTDIPDNMAPPLQHFFRQ